MMINHLTSSSSSSSGGSSGSSSGTKLPRFMVGSWLSFLILCCVECMDLTTGQKKYTKKPASEMQDDHLVLSRQRSPCCNCKGDGEAQIRQLSVLTLYT